MNREARECYIITADQKERGSKFETVANKALHLTAISLRSIAAGELRR